MWTAGNCLEIFMCPAWLLFTKLDCILSWKCGRIYSLRKRDVTPRSIFLLGIFFILPPTIVRTYSFYCIVFLSWNIYHCKKIRRAHIFVTINHYNSKQGIFYFPSGILQNGGSRPPVYSAVIGWNYWSDTPTARKAREITVQPRGNIYKYLCRIRTLCIKNALVFS